MTEPTPIEPSEKFMLPAKLYDRIKLLATIILPAFSTLYFTLGGVWNLPGVSRVIGTCAALITFLGFILSKASRNYQSMTGSGTIHIVPGQDGQPALSLNVDELPENLQNMKAVHLTVKS